MLPLQPQLDQITQQTRRLVQPERLATSEGMVAELFASGIEQRILPEGDRAPEFTLPDTNGKPIHSADLLALGPVILNFFRGRWCPYCMTELTAWRDLYGEVRARGALLLAISPQTVHQNDLLAQQHPLPFPVLSDAGAQVAKQFELTYSIAEKHQRYYRSILVNLPHIHGESAWQLPLPATYVLGRDAVVQYARAYADFRVRPEPEEVLAALSAR